MKKQILVVMLALCIVACAAPVPVANDLANGFVKGKYPKKSSNNTHEPAGTFS